MKILRLFLAITLPLWGCGLSVERRWMPIGDGSRGIVYDRVTGGGLLDASLNSVRAYDVQFGSPIPVDSTPEDAKAKVKKLELLPTTVATQEGWINKFTGTMGSAAVGAGIGGYFAVKAAEALRPDQTNVAGVVGDVGANVDTKVAVDQNQKGIGNSKSTSEGGKIGSVSGGAGGTAIIKDSGNAKAITGPQTTTVEANLNQVQNQPQPPTLPPSPYPGN